MLDKILGFVAANEDAIESMIDFGGECSTQFAFFTGIGGLFIALIGYHEWQLKRLDTEEE